jgi:hypothetical protein
LKRTRLSIRILRCCLARLLRVCKAFDWVGRRSGRDGHLSRAMVLPGTVLFSVVAINLVETPSLLQCLKPPCSCLLGPRIGASASFVDLESLEQLSILSDHHQPTPSATSTCTGIAHFGSLGRENKKMLGFMGVFHTLFTDAWTFCIYARLWRCPSQCPDC